jgi:hypothetical protein
MNAMTVHYDEPGRAKRSVPAPVTLEHWRRSGRLRLSSLSLPRSSRPAAERRDGGFRNTILCHNGLSQRATRPRFRPRFMEK